LKRLIWQLTPCTLGSRDRLNDNSVAGPVIAKLANVLGGSPRYHGEKSEAADRQYAHKMNVSRLIE
jgi:hypothetical protein